MVVPPLWVPPMRLAPRFFVLSVLPAALLVLFTTVVIWGDNGVMVRHQLGVQLDAAQADLADLDGENRRLLRSMRALSADPVVLERMVADELGWSREGDVLVRFDDDAAGAE